MSNIKLWQSRQITQILAVLVGYVPLYLFTLWSHLSERVITLEELFLYPLLLGGGNILLILLLYKFVCGERLASLHLMPGRWFTDLASGIMISILSFGIQKVQIVFQSILIPTSSSPVTPELITLFRGISNNPLLLAFWLGPVVWIGVATFEEMSRVFMLNRLWKIWPKPYARWLFLVISALLFGLVHIYQGSVSVLFVSVQGLLYGWYYLRYGRVWPLIISHGIYDSLQILKTVMIFMNW